MAHTTSLRGPIESVEGKLLLRIPLAAGGTELIACTQGIGEVQGEYLCIHIMEWLAQKLDVSAGTFVVVDNANGKFNVRPASEDPAV